MKPSFKENKTTQAAVFIINKNGGKINYMVLIKLLYLADRESLIRWGRPITFDSYFSMDKGPVLSNALDKINEGSILPSYWSQHISDPKDYDVSTIGTDLEYEELSQAEIDILSDIFTKYGQMDKWELIDKVMHKLPEWKDPSGSSLPIRYRDILLGAGKTEKETELIDKEIESLGELESILQ